MPESKQDRIQLALSECFPDVVVESTEKLEGGVSASMSKVSARLADGTAKKFVARTPGVWTANEPPGFIEREFENLTRVHNAGIPSPKPVCLEPPGNENRFYILEYIEGAPLLNPADPVAFGRKFAELHAQIHGLDLQQNGLQDIRRQPTKLRDSAEPSDPSVRKADVRAALGQAALLDDVNPPVFRHGDLWPGNVLWLDGEVSGIVDWENASIGEPLFDIAITRLDLLWVAGWQSTNAFTEHYLTLRPIDASSLARFDLAAALRLGTELELIASSYPPLGRNDITQNSLANHLGEFVDSALSRLNGAV